MDVLTSDGLRIAKADAPSLTLTDLRAQEPEYKQITHMDRQECADRLMSIIPSAITRIELLTMPAEIDAHSQELGQALSIKDYIENPLLSDAQSMYSYLLYPIIVFDPSRLPELPENFNSGGDIENDKREEWIKKIPSELQAFCHLNRLKVNRIASVLGLITATESANLQDTNRLYPSELVDEARGLMRTVARTRHNKLTEEEYKAALASHEKAMREMPTQADALVRQFDTEHDIYREYDKFTLEQKLEHVAKVDEVVKKALYALLAKIPNNSPSS